jgi:hypothetical protein
MALAVCAPNTRATDGFCALFRDRQEVNTLGVLQLQCKNRLSLTVGEASKEAAKMASHAEAWFGAAVATGGVDMILHFGAAKAGVDVLTPEDTRRVGRVCLLLSTPSSLDLFMPAIERATDNPLKPDDATRVRAVLQRMLDAERLEPHTAPELFAGGRLPESLTESTKEGVIELVKDLDVGCPGSVP